MKMNIKNTKKSIYQTEEFADLKKLAGEEPIFIGKTRKKGIIAFEKDIRLLFIKKRILTSQGTPVFQNQEEGLNLLKEFKKQTEKYFYGTIAPGVINPCHKLFENADFRKVSNHTILIDLSKDEEELWKSLEKKSARWGVKIAEKNNLIFKEANKEELNQLAELYFETAEKGKFQAEKREFFNNFSILNDKDRAKAFVIERDKEIVAGAILFIDEDYTILDLTGVNEKGQKLQAMPFLYWNLIKVSKQLSKKYLDLGGYDKEARKGDKTYNINRFKERFGGKIVEQPIYSTNWKYPLLRKILKKLRFIKRLYRKE